MSDNHDEALIDIIKMYFVIRNIIKDFLILYILVYLKVEELNLF
jgi:hypothetical protein